MNPDLAMLYLVNLQYPEYSDVERDVEWLRLLTLTLAGASEQPVSAVAYGEDQRRLKT